MQSAGGTAIFTLKSKDVSQLAGSPETHAFRVTSNSYAKGAFEQSTSMAGVLAGDKGEVHFWILIVFAEGTFQSNSGRAEAVYVWPSLAYLK